MDIRTLILKYPVRYLAITFVTLLVINTLARGLEKIKVHLFPSAQALEFATTLPTPDLKLQIPEPGLDLDKLAKAVARHETCSCTCGNSAKKNNCFGIMSWDRQGNRYFRSFETKEDSYTEFKRIWATHYKRFPDLALARKYSGNDRPQQWLTNVTKFYESL